MTRDEIDKAITKLLNSVETLRYKVPVDFHQPVRSFLSSAAVELRKAQDCNHYHEHGLLDDTCDF